MPIVKTLGDAQTVQTPAEVDERDTGGCTCVCGGEPVPARPRKIVDPDALKSLAGAPTKRKRRSSRGKGKFCVFSRNDKLVRCFRTGETAERVARGFGPGFRVKERE